jgi:hypothetical protein
LPCASQPQAGQRPQALPASVSASQSSEAAKLLRQRELADPALAGNQQRVRQLCPPFSKLLPALAVQFHYVHKQCSTIAS